MPINYMVLMSRDVESMKSKVELFTIVSKSETV